LRSDRHAAAVVDERFRRKTFAGLVVAALLVLVVGGFGQILLSRQRARGGEALHSKASATCVRAARAVAAGNATAIDSFALDDDLLFAAVVASDGTVLRAAGPRADAASLEPPASSRSISEPDVVDARSAGGVPSRVVATLSAADESVRIALSRKSLDREIASTRTAIAIAALVLFGFGFVAGFALGGRSTRPRTPRRQPALPRPVARAEEAPLQPLVLVVEDDADFRVCLERVLERGGFRVAFATNADQAISVAHRLRPVAVTLDIGLPASPSAVHTSAADVVRALRADDANREVAIVVVTGREADEARDWLRREVGTAPDVLSKTEEPGRVLDRLRKLLRGGGHDMPLEPGARLRILVADDDPDVSWFLSKVLPCERYALESVGDGQQVIDAMSGAKRLPDCLILDLMMPVKDGPSVIRELYAKHGGAPVPIIVVTNFLDSTELREVDDLPREGVLKVITKQALHLDPSVLLRVLDTALGAAGVPEGGA
jgi:CheY-like chemotaxis protein